MGNTTTVSQVTLHSFIAYLFIAVLEIIFPGFMGELAEKVPMLHEGAAMIIALAVSVVREPGAL